MFPTYKHKPKSEFKTYECSVCRYVFDEKDGCPESKIPPGTHFDDLPWDWECPHCEGGKEAFKQS